MQFYKKRDFGEIISASFDFLKLYGKNYFKNYILLNGLILILLLIVFWFGFGELFQQMFSSNLDGQQFFFEQYFTENQGVLIGMSVLAFIIFMLLCLVSYSFPVLYMKRASETASRNITSGEIANDIKNIIGRFLIYFLGLIFIISPVFLLLFGLSALLMMILIGFFLLLLIMPAMMNIMNFTLFHYFHTQSGFFDALRYAFTAQFSKNFWKYWGATFVMYFIINIISSVLTFIPMIFYYVSLFTDPNGFNPDGGEEFGVFLMLIYTVSIVASFILMNLIYINTGFMYYDSREDLHRDVQFSEIETLGQSGV